MRYNRSCNNRSFFDITAQLSDRLSMVMSLPALFESTEKSLPHCAGYLSSSAEKIKQWKDYFSSKPGFKIGICWQADTHNDAQRPPVAQRSISLELFRPIAQLPGVTVYSLQKNVPTPDWMTNFGDYFDSTPFTDSAAIINELDLVISVDTAIAHLAGSLQKKTFTILPWKSDWRWMLNRSDTPWYPEMKLFRRSLGDDWQKVINEIKREVEKLLGEGIEADCTLSSNADNTFETHFRTGKSCLQENKLEDGMYHLFKAVDLRPSNNDETNLILANNLLYLGNTLFGSSKNEAALATFTKILEISDRYSQVYHNIAFTLAERMGKFQQALVNFDKALELKPSDPESHFCRALAHLSLGNLIAGFQDYEYRWQRSENAAISVKQRFPNLWQGESLRGKGILLRVEQGFGDTLHFIRYAALLKNMGAHVIVEVQKQLVPLISLCPYIDQVIALGQQLPPYDYQVPFLSLPNRLQTTLETIPATIPYLYARSDLVAQWKDYFKHDNNYKIGICWRGDAAHGAHKFMPFDLYAYLTQIPGVSVYSLQKVNGTQELNNLKPGYVIHTFNNFDEKNGPFMDTAAIMKNLDLIITADTSIAHLAGALGVKTWVILPFPAEWRWLTNRNDSPWYPTMRLFRQPPNHDWQAVLSELLIELIRVTSKI